MAKVFAYKGNIIGGGIGEDIKVTQTGSVSTNADYEILLSRSANDTTETDTVNKASGLTYNPSTNQLNLVGDLKWEPLATDEHGIYWKEQGYGDKFKIYPYFSGTGEQNYLTVAAATGDADTDPNLVERFRFYPSGTFYTIYGSLRNQMPSVIVDTSSNNHVTANVSTGMYIDDANKFSYSRFRGQAYTNGGVGTDICAVNKKTDGTEVENYIRAYVNKDGTRTYGVSDAANFRTALGLGNMALQDGAHFTQLSVASFDFKATTANKAGSTTAKKTGWTFVCWIACYSTGHTLAGDCYFEYPQNATTNIWSRSGGFTANSTIVKGLALFMQEGGLEILV